jgi:predicted DNA-binding transcriptional regulator AlpA
MSDETKRFLRRPEVEQATGYSISTLYRKAKQGKFPKQIKLGERASGWLQSEVQAWIEDRVAESRGPTE